MIRNRFGGMCACKRYVQPQTGYVVGRRIRCVSCAALAAEADGEDRADRSEFEERDIHGFDDW